MTLILTILREFLIEICSATKCSQTVKKDYLKLYQQNFIPTWCQFHQCFLRAFSYECRFGSFFSTYVRTYMYVHMYVHMYVKKAAEMIFVRKKREKR